MKVTIILSLILMAALFLMLWAAVAFVQSKKFFGSAPKDIQAAVLEHEERFRGARILGWILLVISVLTFLGVFIYAGWDGIQRGYGFWEHTLRYLIMMYLLKAFDIIFFDWILLSKSHFFSIITPKQRAAQGITALDIIAGNILFTALYCFLSLLFYRHGYVQSYNFRSFTG